MNKRTNKLKIVLRAKGRGQSRIMWMYLLNMLNLMYVDFDVTLEDNDVKKGGQRGRKRTD